MSAWIVYSKDGSTERCRLKELEYSGSFMNERTVTATFEYESEVAFDVFDYIEYRGEKFELEAIPSVKKTSSHNYEYELRFVSLKYELERCEMRDIVPNDNRVVYPTPLTFSFTGNVKYLAERIQANLDALYGTGVWSIIVAEGVTSEDKNITISQQNCWNALSLVSTTYGLNFYIKGRNITIGGNQPILNHIFQYGKGNGLYEIERTSDTDTAIITKLRAYGSDRNLDYSYPKKPEWGDSVLGVSFVLSPLRLMLPSFKKDGKTDYILADEATIAEYGIREASVIYDDIYPSITDAKNSQGQSIDEIMAVDAVDDTKSTFVIHLHDLGFDLESHLTTANAQISMKSGAMQGYTFNISEIEKRSDNSYKITLGRITTDTSDTGNYEIPNSSWNMAAGDKFVFLNILMPQDYIRKAENRLLERAKEYLAEYGKTNFSYNVGLHDKFLIENSDVYSSLVEGAKLTINDEVLGISEDVTIQSISITENAEDNILPQVKITLNNKPSASTLDRIQGQIKELSETTSGTFSSQSELLKQYRKKLDKPFFDRLFVAVGFDGKELASTDTNSPIAYIKAKYSFATIGGITMYAQDGDIDIPTIAEGLPFDNRTIWFNPTTKQIEVIGGTGGGSGEGVSNFWDLSGIPSWITNTKPTYSYSEIQDTPDLSKYALVSQIPSLEGYAKLTDIPSLSGYATQAWVNQQGFLKEHQDLSGYQPLITSTNKLTYSLISGTPDLSVYALKSAIPSWITESAPIIGISGVDVSLGGSITQSALRTALGLGSNAYSSTAYLPLSGGTLSGYTETPLILKGTYSDNVLFHLYNKDNIATSIGKYGAYTFLANYANGNGTGELEIHNDGRLTYATGGNNYSIWHEGNLNPSNYLPLSGGTLTGNLALQYANPRIVLRDAEGTTLGAFGLYNNVLSYFKTADTKWYTIYHSGNFTPSNYLPLTGGELSGKLQLNNGNDLELKANSSFPKDSGDIVFMNASGDEMMRIWFHDASGNAGIRFGSSDNTKYLLHAGNYYNYAVPLTSYTASDVLTKLKTVDGSGSGLDADLLDGKHNGELTALYVKSQNVTTDDFSTYLNTYGNQGLSVLNNVSGSDVGNISSISAALNIGSMSNRLGRFIFARHDQSDGLYWQSANSAYNAWGTKRKVAFVDSNVASATKLQTARTIWGQSFDGTGDIDGKLILNNNIALCGKAADGTDMSLLQTTANNNLSIGLDTSAKGYSTYISGNNIYLRYGTSRTNGIILNSSGNVTIGSSDLASTSAKLYVDGLTKITSSTNIGLQIDSSYKGEVTRGVQVLNPSMPFGDSNGVVLLFGQSASAYNCGNIAYRHHGENNTNNYVSLGLYGKDNILVCKANGNVGIDSLNPTAKLHVNGNILSTGRISINPSGSTYDRIRIVASSNGYAYIQASNTDGLEKNGGSLYITGIDTDPLASFEVIASTSKFHGNILATGGITMYSARKLKDIKDERGLSLEELSVIKPTRFTWKDGRDSKIHIGGIADDVMKVLPEVIYKTGEDDTLTMDYGNAAFAISASLIKPVISHEEEIKALKNRIKELEEQVKTLSWNIA